MANKIAYLYVLDTLADWEVGFITAELNTGRYFKPGATSFSVKTVASDKNTVLTMGGLQIEPDYTLHEVRVENTGLLLLPGADTWHLTQHAPVFQLVQQCLDAGVMVAAICGATVALANAGLLNHRKHTSNDLNYLLQTCPNYKGRQHYLPQVVVRDRNLITATALAPLEFAQQILLALNVFSEATLDAWFHLYQTREPRYYMQLMQSIPEV